MPLRPGNAFCSLHVQDAHRQRTTFTVFTVRSPLMSSTVRVTVLEPL